MKTKLTIADCKVYETLRQEKLELERRARDIGKRIAQIELSARLTLGDDNELIKGQFHIHYVLQSGRVAWKEICVARLGADEVQRIQTNVQPTRKLVIERK